MFDIGLQEMVVIGVIALLIFGPSKLPELGRMVGRALREFRRASDEFRSTVETNLRLNDLDPIPTRVDLDPAPESGTPSEEVEAPSEGGLGSHEEPLLSQPNGDESLTEPLCAQVGSRLFHRRECAWAGRIPAAERIVFKQVADARDQGYSTCPVCEPRETA